VSFNIAEVVPAAGAAELLVPLGMLCVLVVVYGMVLGIDAIVRGFFGTVSGAVGWIPYLGKIVESPIKTIERKIVSFLSGLEADIDKAIGWSWHQLASVATHLWHQLERESLLIWHLAKFLSGVPTLHELLHVERWFHREVRRAEAIAEHAIEHAVRHDAKALRSVAHGVFPRLRSLEHEVEHVIPREIKHTRALAKEAEAEAARAWDVIRAHPWTAVTSAFVGAVAIALDRLGLGGLRCSELGNSLRNRGCGFWSALEDLLGLLVDAVLIVDLCALLPELETLFAEVEGPLVSLIASAADAACAHPPAGWVELSAPSLSLPTVYYSGTAIG
jgi:hypothetical protein